jgi:Ankyrin repeat
MSIADNLLSHPHVCIAPPWHTLPSLLFSLNSHYLMHIHLIEYCYENYWGHSHIVYEGPWTLSVELDDFLPFSSSPYPSRLSFPSFHPFFFSLLFPIPFRLLHLHSPPSSVTLPFSFLTLIFLLPHLFSLSFLLSLLTQAGRTALMGASANGHTNVVASLLTHGANVHCHDNVRHPFLIRLLVDSENIFYLFFIYFQFISNPNFLFCFGCFRFRFCFYSYSYS